MAVLSPKLISSPEAYRSHAARAELPECDALRAAALAMAATQFLIMSGTVSVVVLQFVVRAEFALTGFLLAGYLLRDRSNHRIPKPTGPIERAGVIFGSLPTNYLFATIVAVLYLPRLVAVERIALPDINEWPTWIDRTLKSGLTDFLAGSVEPKSLIAWPLLVLFVPRRLLGVVLLSILGCGLGVEFSGLVTSELRPAALLVEPSPLDFLGAGSLGAAIAHGVGQSGNGPLARWALLMGLALGTAGIGFRPGDGLASWGSVALLSAPEGFGAINFILQIMATTFVGSLAWRDIAR